MLPWIIQMTIISLILIILVHSLFTFFITNLTIQKVKDLVNKPQKQYETLFDTMKESNIKPQYSKETNENMKDELKNYLKELSSKKTSSNNINENAAMNISSTPNVNQMDGLMTADTMGSSAYSSF